MSAPGPIEYRDAIPAVRIGTRRDDGGVVAVLEIATADFIRGSNDSGPHRGRSPLRNCLPLERSFAFLSKLRTDPIDQLFYFLGADVASQLGLYATGMHGCGVSTPNAAAVAAATCGLAMLMHIPNGIMLTIGMWSMMFAANWFST